MKYLKEAPWIAVTILFMALISACGTVEPTQEAMRAIQQTVPTAEPTQVSPEPELEQDLFQFMISPLTVEMAPVLPPERTVEAIMARPAGEIFEPCIREAAATALNNLGARDFELRYVLMIQECILTTNVALTEILDLEAKTLVGVELVKAPVLSVKNRNDLNVSIIEMLLMEELVGGVSGFSSCVNTSAKLFLDGIIADDIETDSLEAEYVLNVNTCGEKALSGELPTDPPAEIGPPLILPDSSTDISA